MIEFSLGVASVAHAIHYGVVGVGLVGLFALLGPQLVGGRRRLSADDEHALRVFHLTEQISSGGLGVRLTPVLPVAWPDTRVRGDVDRVRFLFLPIAVVSSGAAASVHAALAPAHARELALFGLFFAGTALAQVGWSVAMAFRPSRPLLVAAVIGNCALLLLWLTTRTVGLPGLLPGPEAIGLWDLACAAWEVALVYAACRILRADAGIDLTLPAWGDWEPATRTWVVGSASVIPVLTLAGVGA